MIDQSRRIFDRYNGEPKFSGSKSNTESGKSGGFMSSLRERLMFAIEKKKLEKSKSRHTLFEGGERGYGDDTV